MGGAKCALPAPAAGVARCGAVRCGPMKEEREQLGTVGKARADRGSPTRALGMRALCQAGKVWPQKRSRVSAGRWLQKDGRREEPSAVPAWERHCGGRGPGPGAGDAGLSLTESAGTQPGPECSECGLGATRRTGAGPRAAAGPRAGTGQPPARSTAGSCPVPCGACGRGPAPEPSTPRKERKELSLTEKVRVLEMLEGPKVSQSELAKRFGVSQPQICRIIKNKERILSEWQRNGNPERKRKREGKEGAVEAALLRWVQGARAAELPISSALLQLKAKHLAEALGMPGFEPSGSWLTRFKLRHNVALEKPTLAQDGGAEHQSSLPELLRSYAPSEVYSCGETEIQLRADGERLTLLLCTNADGSEKAALRAVGRAARPLCLRGINLRSMPWSYRGGGRLSATLFAEWLQDFNEEMQRKGKSVLLLVEEREEHPYLQLSNVRMVFIPPAAVLAQPLHRGIARDLKGHYRRRLLTQIPAARGSEPPTLLDALHMLAQAWGDVRPGLITSCFRAASFSPNSCPDALLAPVWLGQEELESFGLMDEGLERLADADTAEAEDWDRGMEEGEDSGEPVAVQPCPSEPEVWDSLATLRRFLECRATSPDLLQTFYTLQDAVHTVSAGAEPAPLGDSHPKQ